MSRGQRVVCIGGRDIDQLEGTVLLHVQTAAMAVDERGRVGVFNPAAARVLDVPVERVLGRDLDELAGAEPGLAALAGVLQETRRTGVAASPSPGHRGHARRCAHARLHGVVARRRRRDGPLLHRPHRRARRGAPCGRGAAVRRGRPHRRRHGPRAQVAAGHRGALREPDAAGARGRSRRRPAARRDQGPDAALPRAAGRDHALHQSRRRSRRRHDAHAGGAGRCATWSRSCAAATRARASPCA